MFSSQENAITQGFGNGTAALTLGWKTDPKRLSLPTAAGTVVFCQTGYGTTRAPGGNALWKLREAQASNGYFTLYAHLSGVKVSDGQQVERAGRSATWAT